MSFWFTVLHRIGLGVIDLDVVEHREIVEVPGHIRMVGSDILSKNLRILLHNSGKSSVIAM